MTSPILIPGPWMCPCGHQAYEQHGDLRCIVEGCFCDRSYYLAKCAAEARLRLRCNLNCSRPMTRVGNECAAISTGISTRSIIKRGLSCLCDCHEHH